MLQTGASERYIALDPLTGAHLELAASFTGWRTDDGSQILLHTQRDVSEEWRSEEQVRRSHQALWVLSELLRISLEEGEVDDQLTRIMDLVIGLPWLSLEQRERSSCASPARKS